MEALNRNQLAAEMYLLKQVPVSSFFIGYLGCYKAFFWLSSGKPKINYPNHPVNPVKLIVGIRWKTDTAIYNIQE
jgi:hypothetical protein